MLIDKESLLDFLESGCGFYDFVNDLIHKHHLEDSYDDAMEFAESLREGFLNAIRTEEEVENNARI